MRKRVRKKRGRPSAVLLRRLQRKVMPPRRARRRVPFVFGGKMEFVPGAWEIKRLPSGSLLKYVGR